MNENEIKIIFDTSAVEFMLNAFGYYSCDGYVEHYSHKKAKCMFCYENILTNSLGGIINGKEFPQFVCKDIECIIQLSNYLKEDEKDNDTNRY